MSNPYAGPAHESEPTNGPDQSSENKTPRRQSHNTERLKWEDHVIVDQRVSSNAFRVGVYIAGHINEKTRTAWPSTSTIEEALGLPRNAVFKAIKELKDFGHVTVSKRKTKGGGNYNEYQLTFGTVERPSRKTSKPNTAKSKNDRRAPGKEASVGFDQDAVDGFLLEYPLSGKTEDVSGISTEIARAIADGHSFEALLAAADRYRIHCVRHSIAQHQVVAPDLFLAGRMWLDEALFRAAGHRDVSGATV